MSEYRVIDLEVQPYFDLELLLSVSQETRIGGELMEAMAGAWDKWAPHVRAKRIEIGKDSYLLAWLDEAVEEAVDDKWEEAPSEAFLFNALAQVMLMGAVHDLVPQVEEIGCAPAPRPTDALAEALASLGVPYASPGEPGLARRYAVNTYFPFRGGCEICTLQRQCPKGGGQGGDFSITLPGYEK
ncbi:hypothetical protein LJC59_06635 [Desulfovibrio sp. OttesenSCG-928-A18]|nr:hypothetical protein [Desulfovibrio sp. OttesenSCG-928-A18]